MESQAPIRVLAVEDSEEDLLLLRRGLEQAGFRVDGARGATEALRRLEDGAYEVLITDLRLPDGDGLDLLPAVRERDPHAVGIVLTGFASTEAAVGALRRGAYDFLLKPCAPEVLAAAVRRGAERRRLAESLALRTAELESLNAELDRRVRDSTREIRFLNERLKRFIMQLMEAGEQRVQFMDNVTHELKNPLSIIWGHASHLLSRPMTDWTPEELKMSVQAMFRNADSLNTLLEELLDAAKLSGHKMRLQREPLRGESEIAEIVEAFLPQARKKGVTLEAAGEAPAEELSADRLRLRQILSNLISNALKFTPTGGRVTVSCASAGTSVHFQVRDTGVGIPPESVDRVFDRSYQTEEGRRHKGLGLGLEITRGLVTLHGGTIWAESRLGAGSTFHFTIPKAAPDDDAARTPLPRSRSQG